MDRVRSMAIGAQLPTSCGWDLGFKVYLLDESKSIKVQ